MFLGLRTSIYQADDMAATKSWFARLLGAEPYFDEPFYVGFNVGGYELGLVPADDLDSSGLTYWGVRDPGAALDELLAVGATVEHGVTEVGDGIRVAAVRIPGGAVLGVIENPHFALADAGVPMTGPGR